MASLSVKLTWGRLHGVKSPFPLSAYVHIWVNPLAADVLYGRPLCSLLVKWQRWRSCRSIRRSQITHTCYIQTSSLYLLQNWSYRRAAGIEIFHFFGSCNLDPMTFIYTHLTRIPWRRTRCAKMNVLHQGFQKLSSDRHTDSQTSYAWSLPVMWRRWQSHHWIRNTLKPHGTCKPHGSICYRTRVMGDQSLHSGNRHFWPFLLLWPWLWHDDLHIWTWPVFPGDTPDVQIWTSYLKAFKSYCLTDRETNIQTALTEIIKHVASRVAGAQPCAYAIWLLSVAYS